ncbi:MAG: PD40 domain-containing protein [Pyrinomonadaceae bacterium]|nr:PD40 domain-containing protein [Pyrinomonadaceae bacterium]
MREQNHYVYEFGPFHLDATRRLLLKEGEPVKLFPKEFDTLLALVKSNGELLEKDDLMRQVWQSTIVEESNLTTNISHLRKLLGESRGRHDYIVTVPGRGYRFVAGVRQAFDEVIVHERTLFTVEEEESESGGVRRPARHAPSARGHRLGGKNFLLVAGAIVVAAAAFGSYRLIRQGPSKNAATAPFSGIKLTRLTNSGRATLAAISPDGRYIVHVSKDAEGESLWLKQVATESNVLIAPPATISYWGLTYSPDGEYVYCVTAESNKGETALSLIPVLGGPPRRLPVGPHGPVSFSPDGRSLAFIDANRDVFNLYVAAADGGAGRVIARRTSPEKFIDIAVGPAWSPAGDEIACAVRKYDRDGYFDSVISVRVSDGVERPMTARRWSAVGQIAWLPAAGLVVAARESPSAPFQIWHLPPDGGDARRVTNDLNDYHGVTYNARTNSLLALQTHVVSGVWVVPSGDLTVPRVARGQFPVDAGAARQIASGTGRLHDVAWTHDGKVVYVSYASDGSNVWVWEPTAQASRQLTRDARNVHGLAVSPDGRHLVFSSDRANTFNLWRMKLSGGEFVRLTSGEGDVSPRFSPDGRWVVYQRGYPTGARIWRVLVDGGEEIPLTETRGQKPDVSPDGKLIAYYTLDSESVASPWIFGTMPFDGGGMLKRFTFAPTVGARLVRWVPGGWGLAYLDSLGGVSNIWVQPLDGGPPRQLSDFKAEHIDSFDWSPDGRWLAVVRGTETSDVVLIEPKPE